MLAATFAALHLTWRLLRWLVWDKLLGFCTAPKRIGFLILALFVLAVSLVYSDHRNIAPSFEAEFLATTGGATAGGGTLHPPPEGGWNLIDAMAIGLRSHIPMIDWGLRDGWQLAGEGPLYVAGRAVAIMRPEDFGMLMAVLNFLAWPPFLAFALRRAFRYA